MSKKCVLVVEDDFDLRTALCETLQLSGFTCLQSDSGRPALQLLEQHIVDMVVSDVNMAGMDGIELLVKVRQRYPLLPVLLITAYGNVDKAVQAMRFGAVDFMMKPFEPGLLVDTVRSCIGQISGVDIIAEDPASRKLLQLAAKVAQSESTVLILGESGVGKEVIARYIHQHSLRSEGPFVAINCAAIPENMLEATLFGHEKGAYTGAYSSRAGKFEQANKGTLLLDEISEMDVGLQAKLLRVLQEREVERLGGRKPLNVDVRVLATTNQKLIERVAEGKFREDLYYRISVFPLTIPPLRKRPQDIQPLAKHLLNYYGAKMNRTTVRLDESAVDRLLQHAWPGNVRELENVMQRALILQQGETISCSDLFLEHFPEHFGEEQFDDVETIQVQLDSSDHDPSQEQRQDPGEQHGDHNLEENLKWKEFQLIIDVLKKENGSRATTAEKLGISARTLRYKLARMRQSGINVSGEIAAL